jgi:hypothetical protein
LKKFPGLVVQPADRVYYRLVVDESYKEFVLGQLSAKPASTRRGLALNAAGLVAIQRLNPGGLFARTIEVSLQVFEKITVPKAS